LSSEVDFDAFISDLLHWKESTSTSPSRRHLGLYKALRTAYIDASKEFNDPDPDNPYVLTTKAEAILRLIHGLASLATLHGFFLQRWIQVINVVIYKKRGRVMLTCLLECSLGAEQCNTLSLTTSSIKGNAVGPAANARTPLSQKSSTT
jgi:hypothetical protein